MSRIDLQLNSECFYMFTAFNIAICVQLFCVEIRYEYVQVSFMNVFVYMCDFCCP